MNDIPPDFTRRTLEVHGAEGKTWLDHLPALLAGYARRWSLAILPPFLPLSYNYVAPAVRADGTPVVIKAGVPNPELLTEIAALQLFDGHGMVQLLEADPEQGVMLLERLQPGTPLFDLQEEEATSIAAGVMRQLWRPIPPGAAFPGVADWAGGLKKLRAHFQGATGPFPADLVEMAEALFSELISSMAGPVLLHGDLHHWNILAAGRQPWLAIDPKGLAGEPAYETGALLRNPLPGLLEHPAPGRLLARRVDQLADELGFDRQRIAGWGVAQAVLSGWWSFEDHGRGWEPAMACAALLAKLVL